VIVGRNASEHRKLVEKCQARGFISLLEEVPPDSITQCYKSSDVFFSPSIVEGMSLVSIEAMASGLPLVVTDVPGNEDVVRDNGCGVIVKSKDTEAMAAGLHQLLSDEPYRAGLAELSRQRSGKYDWSKIAMHYEEVYQRAICDHDKAETRCD
jgi:glycosyltransferase involved in cell wall biosynthesis